MPATACFAKFVTTWPWITSARVRDAESCDPCALLQAAGHLPLQTRLQWSSGVDAAVCELLMGQPGLR